MSSSASTPRSVVPAQLSYLAIYNPSLSSDDDSVGDQIVFYYSRSLEAAREERRRDRAAAVRRRRTKPDGLTTESKDEQVSEENERLRQVGLAQGMVEFVKNFSNGVPLESVESEKSRVVLKEVEPHWWILAAIDLTQLPSSGGHGSKHSGSGKDAKASADTSAGRVEYSSREVSPASLLLTQLTQAHRGFLLHHAASLSELWMKHENNPDLFRTLLNRHWTRFVWHWDVLLHGNPAAEFYDVVKLAGGGELGMGVGEEEWGSGEREVLEGYAARTEGLVDLLVGRYGDAPTAHGKHTQNNETKFHGPSDAPEPWLGNGESPRAEDGIVFSGIGGVSAASLVSISQWMESIYMHGEAAYGVGENPASRPRRHRKRRKVNSGDSSSQGPTAKKAGEETVHPRIKSPEGRPQDLRRRAIENSALPPGIPAPLVSAVEVSLENATAKASANTSSAEDQNGKNATAKQSQNDPEQGSVFGTEKMMKYLSLGYGTSWTLNPKGFGADGQSNLRHNRDSIVSGQGDEAPESPIDDNLEELDPTPDISDQEEPPFVQRLEQSIGKFLIGLSGDLENTEFEDESAGEKEVQDLAVDDKAGTASSIPGPSSRIFLRTLLVEMSTARFSHLASIATVGSHRDRTHFGPNSTEGQTSASASVDGAEPIVTHEKVRVAVYIHQPFIFVFLFQLHTSNLTIPSFYRAIHHTLGPLQKSLLRSTDPERWRERVNEALGSELNPSSADKSLRANMSGLRATGGVYDLIYDRTKCTIRSSIPNIPPPGSLAAEGLRRPISDVRPVTVAGAWYTLGIPVGSTSVGNSTNAPGSSALIQSEWNRIEALNVHIHVLNLLSASRDKCGSAVHARPNSEEIERAVKTSRGWWIVWMKVLQPKREDEDAANGRSPSNIGQTDETAGIRIRKGVPKRPECTKEAILVRRSPQEQTAAGRDPSRSGSGSRSASSAGRWLLREQPRSREFGGSGSGMSASTGHGVTNTKGVAEGAGLDARKWIDGLIRLGG